MEYIKIEGESLSSLYGFASPIWKEAYKGVIPEKQISFLVDKYFSFASLKSFVRKGQEYYYLEEEGLKIGFMAYLDRGRDLYLDKLYLLKEKRGCGISKQVFNYLLSKYRKDIVLNVNQNNIKAVNSYRKNGFKVIKEERIPLEDGLINIDFVMRLEYRKE